MNKQEKQRAILQQLRSLAHQPDEQASYALALLEQERSTQVVSAALTVVTAMHSTVTQTARPTLLHLYDYYDAAGIKRDAGGQVRSAILAALLPIAHLADRSLAERAVNTYEFLPPGKEECAGRLRVAGLSLLDDLDSFQTSYHCVRLLNDPHTARMSGEPAVSAVRLLVNQGQLLPLYAFVLNNLKNLGSIPEVMAECFKFLSEVPGPIVDDLLVQYRSYLPGTMTPIYEMKDDVEVVGLIDLLLVHAHLSSCFNFIEEFLRETKHGEVYRYLVNMIVANRQPELWALLLSTARKEQSKQKIDILLEAFDLIQSDYHIAELVNELQKRR